eukprot:FR735199.1.p1 GENE.FR735199.1~~FR735199.1.p1  ORF type:complete len:261 (+),score=1.17 FR735199.1:31-783(+)
MRAVRRGETSSTYVTLITAMNRVLRGWRHSAISRCQRQTFRISRKREAAEGPDALDVSTTLTRIQEVGFTPGTAARQGSCKGHDPERVDSDRACQQNEEGLRDLQAVVAREDRFRRAISATSIGSYSSTSTNSSLSAINEDSTLNTGAINHHNDKELVVAAILRENPNIHPEDVKALYKAIFRRTAGRKRPSSMSRGASDFAYPHAISALEFKEQLRNLPTNTTSVPNETVREARCTDETSEIDLRGRSK